MKEKKKIFQKKKVWLACGLAVGIVIVSGGIYFVQGKSAGKASAEEMPVQETQAKKETISNSIVGTGNLEYEQGDAVTIPTGIIVEEVKVESGDQVSKGDVLAVVNQTSVFRAMEEIQEQMEELDEEINESKEESDTQSVESKVDGRVKKIYVQQRQEASECMVEQGALMLLSIDGFLAVEFETDAEITKEDSVTVSRADETQKEGTVENISDGKCTVLFSDSGVGIEEEVTILDSEGNTLGSGTTYIHQPLAITAASGTVKEIYVSEDEAVYTGTVLFTVDQGGESLEYQEQMAERQELAQNLQKLMILSKSGTITAESSGTIQSVNISAESSQSTQGNTGTVQISKQNSQNKKENTMVVQVSKQNNQATKENTGIIQISKQTNQSNIGNIQLSKQESDMDINPQPPLEKQGTCLSLEITDSGSTNQNLLVIETPKTDAKPQTELIATDGSYEGIISWNPKDKKFAAKTSYQAEVELNARDDYYFTKDSVNQIKTGVLSGISVSEDGKTLMFQITYPLTESEKNDDIPNNNENENHDEDGNDDDNGTNEGNGNNNGNHNENENQNDNGTNEGNGTNNGNHNENENQNDNGTNEGNGTNNGNHNENENQNDNGTNENNGNSNGDRDEEDENNEGNGNDNGNETNNGGGDENNNGNQENNGTQEGVGNNNTNGFQEGNISGIETGREDYAQSNNGISQTENSISNEQIQTTSSNTSDSGNGTQTSSTTSSNSAQSNAETSSDVDDNEITAFTLATADTMILSVNVDELDINSVSKEQQAEIVLDAIEDEVFTGTVTKVGSSASSSSGGVAKYTVEISIPRDERMKEGMNASATITVEERENVVTIPVNALQERGNRVFVYTETDSDGSLLGEKEVTTGLSDGSNVEITEGLSEGDIVYYRKIGNTSQKNGEQNFHKMEGGPNGDMGNMRQGDFPGGGSGGGMPNGRE